MKVLNAAYVNRLGDVYALARRPSTSPGLGADTPVAFIDSPMMSFVMSAAAALPAGVLAVTYGKNNSSWASFFWTVTGLATMKGLYDLSKVAQQNKGGA